MYIVKKMLWAPLQSTRWCKIHWGMEWWLGGVSYTAKWRLGCVSYSAKWRLHGVRYTPDLQSKMKKNLCGVSYTAKRRLHGVSYTVELPFGGVRYSGEAIAKQMKATTAFKGTILQKTDQNLTLLSNSMMNMNLKFSKWAPCNRLRGVSYTAETISYSNIFVNIQQKLKSSQCTSNGTRRSYLMKKTNTQKSRVTVSLKKQSHQIY